jgi:hypothetical protein
MTDIFQQVAAAIKMRSPNPDLCNLAYQIQILKEIHGYIDLNNKNTVIEGELKQFFLFCLRQYFENQKIDKNDLFDELFKTIKLMNLDAELQKLPGYKKITLTDIPEINHR